MPPLTATPKALEPRVLAPTDLGARDAWIEKVFGPRKCQAETKVSRETQQNSVHRQQKSNHNGDEACSYSEELAKHIADSCANWRNDGEEPLDDSDESSSDEETEGSDDIFALAESQPADKYVEPPVDVPRTYRAQDLQGGMLVGGDCVVFTNWAFKRQLRRMRRLAPIPERGDAGEFEQSPSDDESRPRGVYSGKVVEL
ncbi:Calcium-activated potassium channel subunit alpha-1 [Phytophthora cinnamomi]|uniref:Calcium-activated potassium channel subunit alpha-1 n=1 Tax=Phytophthora cinnamomi TaxID=4785 RepID=UPI00355A03A6|nr:Calcium-activated potassium channel subunit alpha-1 [Phytophthora cinnamomi]